MKDNVSLSQDALVDLVQATTAELYEQLDGVDADVVVYAAENWTAKEILAHIHAWMTEAHQCVLAHKQGEQHRTQFENGDTFNREQVALRSAWSYRDMVSKWVRIHADICIAIGALSREQYLEMMTFPWGAVGKVDAFFVHMLEHEREHINDISSHAKAQRR